ncbi:MAG: ribosomal protein S18-alanine N-acetyltransferase [Dehalococcoidia bacterium]|nr:ribosomal protein S18-alanine N-acetyltransferase [Dehalococcoidia bacterium]
MEPTAPRISLRDMTRDDVPAVKRIESAAYQDAWPARLFEKELANGFAQYVVAVEETADPPPAGPLTALRRAMFGGTHERIVGFMGVWYMVDQLHLVTIAVDPGQQRRGIGTRLLLEVFDLAMEAELNEIVLEVRESNDRARAMYEAFGFRKAGQLLDYYKDNHETAIVMLSGALSQAGERIAAIREGLYAAHPGVFEG